MNTMLSKALRVLATTAIQSATQNRLEFSAGFVTKNITSRSGLLNYEPVSFWIAITKVQRNVYKTSSQNANQQYVIQFFIEESYYI